MLQLAVTFLVIALIAAFFALPGWRHFRGKAQRYSSSSS